MIDRIYELAKNMRVSISNIEKAVGLSNEITGKWKKQSPTCDKLQLAVNYLNVSIDYLMNENESVSYENKVETEQTMSDTSRELLKIFESLPMGERVKLLGMIYDFEEQYIKNGTVDVQQPELPLLNNPLVSENEQKLLEVFHNFTENV